MRGIFLAGACGIALMVVAANAKAAPLTFSESGIVTGLYESDNNVIIAPTPGQINVGDSYILTATFDPATAEVGSLYDADPTINIYSLPGTTVSFTSGSYSTSFSPSLEFDSSIQLWNNYTSNGSLPPTDNQSLSFFNYQSATHAFDLGAGNYSESLNADNFDFTAMARDNDLISELPSFDKFESKSFSYGLLNSTDNRFEGVNGTVLNESLSAVSAAPEPSTWGLMFAGVAGLGLMLRSKRVRLNRTLVATAT